jgi:UDP-hydrolysing UDP-N-acetyl-D-glucosamine 2-epimerase
MFREGALRRICVFTGTRAEYGLLKPLIARLVATPGLEAQLLITGAHLSVAHGMTASEIDLVGVRAVERVPILDGDESDLGVARAMGSGVHSFAEALERLRPDILVILGDRYEALAAATAATVMRVPIAHLHGGELSLGAMDDVFRHAITKMSHLHFASAAPYRQRIIRMGEAPDRVFDVGALGVENALNLPLLPRAEVEAQLGLATGEAFALLTYHPVTLDTAVEPQEQVRDILAALAARRGIVTIATGANADSGGARINAALKAAAEAAPARVRFRMSLGSLLYLSALKHCSLVIGNSSSGLIEAPSFGVPVIDIGSRQAGRIRADNVISCAPEAQALAAAVAQALSPAFRRRAGSCANPYYKPDTSRTITETLRQYRLEGILAKGFHDMSVQAAAGDAAQ